MLTLAIESTAHTFGSAVIDSKGKILSDIRDMYQTKKEGLEPRRVAEHHKNIGNLIIEKALKDSKKKMKDISFISFSQGPGLPLSLVEGMRFAKLLSEIHKKPLIGVNHICAHLEIGKLLTKARNPVFVFASGANTQIIAHEGEKYRIFGECLSIALGNALDKFARDIGLGFPGGPKIEELAKSGKKYIELPYVVKGMDIEFSGIVTHAINLYKKGVSKEDLCYSLQETMFAMLIEVTERALAHCDKNEVLLIGGVAANQRLCEMLNIMCRERKAKFYAVPIKYSGDNAAMIGWQGVLEHKKRESLDKIDIKPNWRIDQVETSWIK